MIFQKIYRKIKARIKLFKDRRFLRKYGCDTWKEYYLKTDYRINRYAEGVNDYYPGYSKIAIVETVKPFRFDGLGWEKGLGMALAWCDKNCKHRWRSDFHRVYKNTWLDEWRLNELGDTDILVFAFESEKDYTWFKLRWL